MASGEEESLTIRIEGGPPFGFRLFGGDGRPLVIAKLRRRSKAWDAGLEEGDLLLSINEHSCRNISHAAAMNLVDNAGHFLELRVQRRGWVAGQLQVSRAGSRQRSLTPSATPLQFKTTPSPDSPGLPPTQSVQWSSRTTASIHQPTVNRVQQRTFEIHLSEPETGRPGDDDYDDGGAAWKGPSRSWLRDAKEQTRSPSNGPLLFSVAAPPQPKPSAAPNRKSPAVWKPPSWQPETTEPRKTSLSQEVGMTRFNATQDSSREETPAAWKPPSWQTQSPRTTFSHQNQASTTSSFISNSSKENVAPVVNRSTPVFQANRVEVAKHKPNVWQPDAIPQVARKTFPLPLASPVVDSGPEFDVHDGGVGGGRWKPPTRTDIASSADGSGKAWNEIPPHLNKIISGNVDNDDQDFGSIINDNEKKVVFVDSSFYRDPAHKYPTVDEQIKMARQVALSLTAPSNAKARGHRMFMKRKETSDKWVVDAKLLDRNNVRGSDSEADLYYNPTPWSAASTWKAAPGGTAFPRDVPAPPPLPASRLFAPKLNPEDETGERSKALSAEEFERLRLFSQKTTHNTISPQICFTLAEDLRQSKGKGGRMFAKRRAKSDEWAVEGPTAPDPKLLQKIGGGYAPAEKKPAPVRNDDPEREGVDLPPLNRLKEMIELPKAKITPWDAVAEFGNVDMAFEHLEGISFLRPKGSAYADSVASSLQQATRRKSDLTTSRPTSAKAPPLPHHPSPISPAPSTWNRPKELTTNTQWGSKTAPLSPAFVDFSPSSYGSGSGYRPVAFQSSSGNASVTGGFSDL